MASALKQQAATSEILRVISASPSDVQPVLDTVVKRAALLCKAPFARVLLADGDELRVLAEHSRDGRAQATAARVPLSRTSISGRAVIDGKIIHHADILPLLDTDFPDTRENVHRLRARAVLAVPLTRKEGAYGAIFLWRREPGLFAPDQVALVQTFAAQIGIAIDNVRLFKSTKEALEQQTATSEILRAISQSPTNVQPVFDIIGERAEKLCDAQLSLVSLVEGQVIQLVAAHGVIPGGLGLVRSHFPMQMSAETVTARTIRGGDVVHVTDVLDIPGYEPRAAAVAAGFRGSLCVPMLRDGEVIGSIFVSRRDPGRFTDSQVELLKTFADQAVIAIQNVRLFEELEARNRDLTEALEQQTATSEILRAISESPQDVQPVFEAIASAALKLCRATLANVFRFDGDLIHLAVVENANVDPEYSAAIHAVFPRAPGRDTAVGRTILERNIVAIPDVLEDREYAISAQTLLGGFRSALGVPLMREENVIGAIVVCLSQPGQFAESQVALLKTFADQAVIAIQNVRLFKELEARNRDLTEALEQQTATSEILRVISRSPANVQPVFDIIAQRAGKLCGADFAVVSRFDGDLIELAAINGLNPEGVAMVRTLFPMNIGAQSVTARTIRGATVAHYADVLAERDYELKDFARTAHFRSSLGVPIVRNREVIGSIVIGRAEPGLFADSQVQLLKTFADQAVIAIENVRLFTELDVRNRDLTEALEQQTATSEILRVISKSPTNVQPVFDTIAAATLRLCAAGTAVVTTFDGKLIHVGAMANVDPKGAEAISRIFPRPPSHDNATTRAILTHNVVAIPDIFDDPSYAVGAFAIDAGFRSALAVPLLRDGNPIGAITAGRVQPGPFSDQHIALLQTFADQAVIAIENVRLFMELQTRTTELTQSVGELKALGEVGQAVSSTLDLETVLSTIVSRATQLAGVDGGAIYEYAEEREEFYLHTADRLPLELVEALRARPIRKGDGALGRLAVVGEPVEIRDIADEKIYQSAVRKILIRLGYRSLLAVPLLREGHLLGGLVVNRKTAGEFKPQVVDLLKTFAAQSALAIQNARLFREIEAKSRQLETASRHKSEFLANMSHELRTPLNAIIGFSEVLHERMFGEINDKQAEYLSDILESGRHLLSLINDILDLSKIEAGRMELDSTEFSLPAAIDNTLTLIRERAHRRAITLERNVDDHVEKVRGDERKVKQVILNLLSNALKFTPEGGRIAVRARIDDGWAEVSVTDNGVGIAPEDQQTVFDEFRQVGSAAKKVEGTGLGLAISRKFIELHGGRIWVTSKVGAGSTFAFTLPSTTAARDTPA